MSKQNDAKIRQNYRTSPNCCHNCRHYQSNLVVRTYIEQETHKRCGLGGFAVGKMATCDEHSRS